MNYNLDKINKGSVYHKKDGQTSRTISTRLQESDLEDLNVIMTFLDERDEEFRARKKKIPLAVRFAIQQTAAAIRPVVEKSTHKKKTEKPDAR